MTPKKKKNVKRVSAPSQQRRERRAAQRVKTNKVMATEPAVSIELAETKVETNDIIELPPMDPITVETFKFDASRVPALARAVVGEGPGWQRRFGRLVGLPPGRVSGAVGRARRGRGSALQGAPAVRCALLARRLGQYVADQKGSPAGR